MVLGLSAQQSSLKVEFPRWTAWCTKTRTVKNARPSQTHQCSQRVSSPLSTPPFSTSAATCFCVCVCMFESASCLHCANAPTPGPCFVLSTGDMPPQASCCSFRLFQSIIDKRCDPDQPAVASVCTLKQLQSRGGEHSALLSISRLLCER